MLDFFRRLDPMQRMALMVGVPVVALVVILNRRSASAPPETAPPAETDSATVAPGVPTAGWVMPSTDAIGTGSLMDFLSQINQNQASFLSQLTETIKAQDETVTPPPVTPPPVTPPPTTTTPAPTPTAPTTPARPARPPAPPAPPAPKPPAAAYNPHNDPQLGKRTSVVGAGGESITALAARLYRDGKWWQELYWLNAKDWNAYAESKGQRITSGSFVIPGGLIARY
jgi:hypothetical protein